jgi:hypothetical protein
MLPKQKQEGQTNPIDITTKESRESLAKMVTKLFDHWQITPVAQCLLLGMSSGGRMTLNRYRRGFPLGNSIDLLARVGHLISIHKTLRIMFPQNRDLVYRWVSSPNARFAGRPPLEIMCEGYEGLMAIRRYLDFERDR